MKKTYPKATRTVQHLLNTSPKAGFDGYESAPPVWSPPGSEFVRRLTVSASLKVDYSIDQVCEVIAKQINDTLFFCDTSLFDTATDARLWEVLLRKRGRIVIIPHVNEELKPWLAANPNLAIAKAIRDKDPGIDFYRLDRLSLPAQTAFAYYVNLLGIRKRLMFVKTTQFEAAYGRPPDDQELRSLKEEVHRETGPRGYLLANKGFKENHSQTYYTDEALVYLAMSTGIATGTRVIILTKDEDVLEQFYKLQWLLDTHYRSMLLAERYASDPASFTAHLVANDTPDGREAFEDTNVVLIERSSQMLWDILPRSPHFVALSCCILGERLSQLTFGAEKEMSRLLTVKGKTRGLNTDRLGGRNCHLWLAPLDIPEPLRHCSAIVHDRRVKLNHSLAEIPLFDANQAIFTGERFRHLMGA